MIEKFHANYGTLRYIIVFSWTCYESQSKTPYQNS